MNGLPPGRIPFEDIAHAKAWAIPSVKGNPVNSAEQRKRKTQTQQNKVKQHQRVAPQQPVISEAIEEPTANHRLTAQQLEEITQAAEHDGFAKGYEEGVDQGKQDGRKAGYSDGLKAGTEQAESEHGQWLREQGEHLQKVYQALMAPLAHQQQDLADAVLDLALGLTKHLLDAELQLNPRHIVAVVDKALAALPPVEEGIQLVLHPDDHNAFIEYSPKAALVEKIKTDASLTRGSCLVNSEHSFVDYSVATRLHEFIAALANKPFDEAASELTLQSYEREPLPIDDSALTKTVLNAEAKKVTQASEIPENPALPADVTLEFDAEAKTEEAENTEAQAAATPLNDLTELNDSDEGLKDHD